MLIHPYGKKYTCIGEHNISLSHASRAFHTLQSEQNHFIVEFTALRVYTYPLPCHSTLQTSFPIRFMSIRVCCTSHTYNKQADNEPTNQPVNLANAGHSTLEKACQPRQPERPRWFLPFVYCHLCIVAVCFTTALELRLPGFTVQQRAAFVLWAR